MSALHDPIMNKASREEHDEALAVMCNLSLNTFSEFEPYAQIFLDDILPTLPDLKEDENLNAEESLNEEELSMLLKQMNEEEDFYFYALLAFLPPLL